MARPKKSESAAAEEVKTAAPEETAEEKAEETVQEEQIKLTKSELNALIAEAVAAAVKDAKPVLQVAPTEDPVVLLFLGGIMPGSTVALGELGSIYRDGGTLTVSKENFFSKLGGTAEYLLRMRQLIVVSGLNDEERERYGVLYKDNELLTAKTYGRLLHYEPDELCGIYRALCPEHRKLAAKAFRSAMDAGDGRVTADKLKKLYEIDREGGVKDYAFKVMYDIVRSAED